MRGTTEGKVVIRYCWVSGNETTVSKMEWEMRRETLDVDAGNKNREG
jgi:hypothetical protein